MMMNLPEFVGTIGTPLRLSYVLDLVKQLNANEPDQRMTAYDLLECGTVVNQGDLYEAAYYVIDPVTDLLLGECYDPAIILDLIVDIAYGAAAPTRTFTDEHGKVRSIHEACKSKLKSHRDFYASLSFDDEKAASLLESIIYALDNMDFVDSPEFTAGIHESTDTQKGCNAPPCTLMGVVWLFFKNQVRAVFPVENSRKK